MATDTNFQPAFTRIQQAERHDDVLAVIAMLGGTTLEAVRTHAEALGVPKIGPYHAQVSDADLIAKLLSKLGLVGTVWKSASSFADLPAVAIAGVDADFDYEVCRCVLYHRMPVGKEEGVMQYVLDPYPHADAKLHARTDLSGLVPSWYIGIHQAPATKAKGK